MPTYFSSTTSRAKLSRSDSSVIARAAVLDHEGLAMEAPDVRQRLVQDGGFFDQLAHGRGSARVAESANPERNAAESQSKRPPARAGELAYDRYRMKRARSSSASSGRSALCTSAASITTRALAALGRRERQLLEQRLHDRVQPARADVLGAAVGFLGVLGDRRRPPPSVNSSSMPSARISAVYWRVSAFFGSVRMRTKSPRVERVELDADREAALQLGDQVGRPSRRGTRPRR